jgi:hypothetical protein
MRMAVKQDCETNAAKRFIQQLRKDYPRQKFILGGDGLMSHQPMIETVMDNNMHYLFVAKPGDINTCMSGLRLLTPWQRLRFIAKKIAVILSVGKMMSR